MDQEKEQEFENFRLYHNLQYDRIDKLESRREIFNSIVLTASLGIITFGFNKENQANIYTGTGLVIIVFFANLLAVVFSSRTHALIKMHQERARLARDKYAPQFNKLNEKAKKPDSEKDWFNRKRLYDYLHVLTIFVIIIVWISVYFSVEISAKNNFNTIKMRKIDVQVGTSKSQSTTVFSETTTY